MAHTVTVKVPARPVARADVEFVVKKNDGVLGSLKISQGAVNWLAKGTTYSCKMSWAKFDKVMRENATRTERRNA